MFTEFFETLSAAERWAAYDMKHKTTDVLSMDKPGTVRDFKYLREEAFYDHGRKEAATARACVIVYN